MEERGELPEEPAIEQPIPRYGSGLEPIDRMLVRIKVEGAESPSVKFDLLVSLGEYAMKLTTSALLGAIEDERDGHRYRLEHSLVRANASGAWESALTEVLTGPPNQFLLQSAWEDAEEISGTIATNEGRWQAAALRGLVALCRTIDPALPELPRRTNLLTWFRHSVWLRNQRAHRPLSAEARAKLVVELAEATYPLTENLGVFRRPWAVLRRTYSGKHHVAALGGDSQAFEYLKSAGTELLEDGVYTFYGGPVRVGLVTSDVEKSDFFLPNGNLRRDTYEGVSYVTGATSRVSASRYLSEPSPMATSETHGLSELDVQGNAFGNVPPITEGYVRRPDLESELEERLRDDRYPVVTLSDGAESARHPWPSACCIPWLAMRNSMRSFGSARGT